jgi:hypothetical protein
VARVTLGWLAPGVAVALVGAAAGVAGVAEAESRIGVPAALLAAAARLSPPAGRQPLPE